MNKYQEIIIVILDTPLSNKEKLDLVSQVVSATSDIELDAVAAQVANYLDLAANKTDEEQKIYEKYSDVIEKMDEEVLELQEKPLESFKLSDGYDVNSSEPTQTARDHLQHLLQE